MSENPFGDRSDIMTPVPDETMARLAEIEAMRAMTRAVEGIGRTVEQQGRHLGKVDETLSDMRATLAELRVEKEILREVKNDVKELSSRVDKMEDAHVVQRTWVRAGQFVTQAIPWLLGLCGMVYGLISSKHS